jgi:hypothetical protein
MNLTLTQAITNLFTASGISPGTELIVQNIGTTKVSFSIEAGGATRDYVAGPQELVQVIAGATAAFASAYQAASQDATIISVRSRAQFDMLRPFTGVDVGPAGPAGTPGATGPAGDGSLFPKQATQIIAIGHAVRAVGENQCGRADKNTPSHAGTVIGIATNDANAPEMVQIRTAGYMTVPSWTWTPYQQVFVGIDGSLTQVAPESGFCQTVALAVSPNTVLVRVDTPILL